jgi:hypothetical protein
VVQAMHVTWQPLFILQLFCACASSQPPTSTQVAHPTVPSTPPPQTSLSAIEEEPVPDSWKRYYLDSHHFSAQFPGPPKTTDIAPSVTYEAHNAAGSIFMVVCSPEPEDHGGIKRAHDGAAEAGRILSEGSPDFYGASAYEADIRLPDGSQRLTLFVNYGGRFCVAGAELTSDADELQAIRFIGSFRPEPVPPLPAEKRAH